MHLSAVGLSHLTREDVWQKLSTVSKVPAAEYFVKNFRIWCQGCRLCGVVPTTLAQSVMFQNRRSKNISRAKREDSAKDVQISPVPDKATKRSLDWYNCPKRAASTTLRFKSASRRIERTTNLSTTTPKRHS